MNELQFFLNPFISFAKRLIEIEREKETKGAEGERKARKKEKVEQRWAKMRKRNSRKKRRRRQRRKRSPYPGLFNPCHILCGFYSEPGKFWLSFGE